MCVFQPTLKDLIDIYQCRQSLESLASKLAAKNINDIQIGELYNIINQTNKALDKGDMTQVVQLNVCFHEQVLEISGNHQLITLTSTIRDKVTYLRNCSFKGNVREVSFLREHERIVDALRSHDGDQAEIEMHNHIEHDLQALISLYTGGNIWQYL
ncbi:GntR family transcriptional regulator [Bacillota bacterium Lsc_1132]